MASREEFEAVCYEDGRRDDKDSASRRPRSMVREIVVVGICVAEEKDEW